MRFEEGSDCAGGRHLKKQTPDTKQGYTFSFIPIPILLKIASGGLGTKYENRVQT